MHNHFSAFNEVGGYSELQTKYLQSIPDYLIPNTTCGIPRKDSWVLLRDPDPTVSDMPWPAFLLGQTPASIWYWCADQVRLPLGLSGIISKIVYVSHSLFQFLFAK